MIRGFQQAVRSCGFIFHEGSKIMKTTLEVILVSFKFVELIWQNLNLILEPLI